MTLFSTYNINRASDRTFCQCKSLVFWIFFRQLEKSVNVMYIIKPYSIRRYTFHCNVMINHKINANQPLVAKDPANTVLEFDLGKASDLYGSSSNRQFFANIQQGVSLGGFSTESLIVLFIIVTTCYYYLIYKDFSSNKIVSRTMSDKFIVVFLDHKQCVFNSNVIIRGNYSLIFTLSNTF